MERFSNILVIGLNHKTAPIEIREKFCLRPTDQELLLAELRNDPHFIEVIVLSTCNRTEIYAHMIASDPKLLFEALCRVKKQEAKQDWNRYFYAYTAQEAIRHFFGVACGLDSLILGEKQILGQVKAAAELSRRKQMMGKLFNILSNLAVRTGKKARNETSIANGGSSISWAAVTMAQDLLGTLQDKSVLLIGTGKMGKIAVSQLQGKGTRNLYVMNRTFEKAVELAQQFGGKAVSFGELKEILMAVDVCICSADAPHHIIEKNLIEDIMRRRQDRNLICIDISMPRNISPDVASLDKVALVTVDDLDKVLHDNLNKRGAAVGQVEGMIAKKVEAFYRKITKIQQMEEMSSIFT